QDTATIISWICESQETAPIGELKPRGRCPFLGHKQTFCDARVISASTRKQTFASVTCQKRTSPCQRAILASGYFPFTSRITPNLTATAKTKSHARGTTQS